MRRAVTGNDGDGASVLPTDGRLLPERNTSGPHRESDHPCTMISAVLGAARRA